MEYDKFSQISVLYPHPTMDIYQNWLNMSHSMYTTFILKITVSETYKVGFSNSDLEPLIPIDVPQGVYI